GAGTGGKSIIAQCAALAERPYRLVSPERHAGQPEKGTDQSPKTRLLLPDNPLISRHLRLRLHIHVPILCGPKYRVLRRPPPSRHARSWPEASKWRNLRLMAPVCSGVFYVCTEWSPWVWRLWRHGRGVAR